MATMRSTSSTRPDATYLVVMDEAKEKHLGSVRLLPTTKPHLLSEVFPMVCDDGVPVGDDIWEITRFCAATHLRGRDSFMVQSHLAIGIVELALLYGITRYTCLAVPAFLSTIMAVGWECEPLGLPRDVNGETGRRAADQDLAGHAAAPAHAHGAGAIPSSRSTRSRTCRPSSPRKPPSVSLQLSFVGKAMSVAFAEPRVSDWTRELHDQGYCIVPGVMPKAKVHALHNDLKPRFERTPFCEGEFYGSHTKRFGGLLKRSAHAAAFVQQPLILDIAQAILGPFCERIQLNLTQALEIWPGEWEQVPHRDQDMWRGPHWRDRIP